MSSTDRTIVIEDVGPVQRLAIALPAEGGVVVLRGHNGAGKSLALAAAQALASGDGKVAVRDGAPGAHVAGLGARLTVGRRTTRTGDVTVRHLDGIDPSLLVDPGLKDPAAADAARLRALCVLAGAAPDVAAFRECVPAGDLAAPDLGAHEFRSAEDVPALASKVKRALEARARQCEQHAQACMQEATGLREAVADVPPGEVDERVLADATEGAVRELAALEARAKAVEHAHAHRARMEAVLVDAGAQDLGAAEREWESASEQFHRLTDEVALLKRSLAEAEQRRARASKALTEAKQRDAALVEARAALAAEMPAMVDRSSVVAARDAVEVARRDQEAGAVRRRALAQRQRADVVEAEASTAAMLADAYRQGAARTEAVLTAAIARIAPRGLRVEAGRVLVHYPERAGDVPYAELSHGERWRLALDVAVDAVGEGGLLVVRQEAWEGLDPANRDGVAAHAKARRTVVLTAEAAAGDVEAVVYDESEVR